MKQMVTLGGFLGSIAGSYIPALWGGSLFSFSSILFGAAGGAAGIILAWNMTK